MAASCSAAIVKLQAERQAAAIVMSCLRGIAERFMHNGKGIENEAREYWRGIRLYQYAS